MRPSKARSLVTSVAGVVLSAISTGLYAEGSLIEPSDLSGSLRAAYWNRNKDFEDSRHYGSGSLWASFKPKEVHGVRLVADGFWAAEGRATDFERKSDVREAYVETSISSFDFKAGRFISVWGRGDKVNPTDSLSVRNFKLLITDDEDQRTGVGSVQLAYNVDTFRIIAMAQPEWREPVLPIRKTTGVNISYEKPQHPERQFAFKLDQSGGTVDWSVSYASVINRTPDFVLDSVSANGIDLLLNFNPIVVWGADFATNLNSFGIRGEIAYTRTKDSSGDNLLIQNDTIFGVLGADKTIVENLNLNAQVMLRSVRNFRDPNDDLNPLSRGLSETLNLNANQQSRQQVGGTLRPSYKMFNEALELEIAYVTWFKPNKTSLVRPKASYSFSDSLRGYLGGEWFEGPDDSYFGRLKETSSLFSEVRLLF